jgi:hypothetical protein
MEEQIMNDNLQVVSSVCPCGTAHQRFQHRCAASGEGVLIVGCPTCDDHCPKCDLANHCCEIEEVIGWLMRIREQHGKRVRVMICFDGGEERNGGKPLPYIPVNQVAMDDDDPADPIALVCVCEGNHPMGNVIKLRPADWDWKAK